jgi:hypothetical protein
MASPLSQSIRPSGQGGDYTSLSGWEAQNLDLVALDSSSYAMIDGNWSGSVDTTAVTIDGWTTNTTCSITIECIGTGSRHEGVWDDTKYKLQVSNNSALNISENYVFIEGLQIYSPTTDNVDESAIQVFSIVGGGELIVESCILRGGGSGAGTYNDGVNAYNNGTHITKIYNCIAFDFTKVLDAAFSGWETNVESYNCTAYNCNYGFFSYGVIGDESAINCIAQNNVMDFSGSFVNSSNNISEDTTARGANSITSSTVLFIDSASYDFRLSPYDTVAIGNGISLYTASYAVTTDIAGISRGNSSASYFDIGAFHSTQSIQRIRPSGQSGSYTSLATWEAQNQDLVSVNKSIRAEIDGNWSGSVDGAFTIAGWTTDATHDITIECIGTGSRNVGVWDDTKYILSGNSALSIPYINIYGLQVRVPISNYPAGFQNYQNGLINIDSCLFNIMGGAVGQGYGIGGQFANKYSSSLNVSNCIFYATPDVSSSRAISIYGAWNINNCTAYGLDDGYFNSGNTPPPSITNTIVQNCGVAYNGTFVSSSNNISNDTTAPGNNSITSSTVLFVDSASYDFRLSPYDTVAIGNGISLYTASYAVTTDIAGISRGNESASYFDIGAFHSTQSIQRIRPSGQSGSYTTLATWEAGENTDLVAVNKSIKAEIDGDWSGSIDASAVTLDGWTVDATHDITIECIGTGSRHEGVWDETKYVLSGSGNWSLKTSEVFVSISGLQIKKSNTSVSSLQSALDFGSTLDATASINVDSCILYADTTGYSTYAFLGNFIGGATNRVFNFNNNLIMGKGVGGAYFRTGGTWNVNNCTHYIENGTVGYEIALGGGSITATNCISQGTSTYGFDSGFTGASSNNVSDDSTAPGNNSITSSTVLFVDSASYDFRLSPYDTVAIGNGISLYTASYAVTTDIAGISRGNSSAAYFDIGAFHSTQSIKTIQPSGQSGSYTTVTAFISGEQQNIVDINKSIVAEIGGDWSSTTHTSNIQFSGFTTNNANYIELRTDSASRHNGIWDSSKCVLQSNSDVIIFNDDHFRAIGLQILLLSNTRTFDYGIFYDPDFAGGQFIADSNIIWGQLTGSTSIIGINIRSTANLATSSITNNIVYGVSGSACPAIQFNAGDGYIYNNTCYGNGNGIQEVTANSCIAINNICDGNYLGDFDGNYDAGSGYNVSSDTTAPGANSFTSSTVLFVDSASYDFRLSPYDTVAIGNGISLYTASYAVTTDIAGTSRGNSSASYFDIGAFHSTQSIQLIKPSGQSGSYTTLATWEAGENTDLVAVNKSIVAEIQGDWSGGPDTTAVTVSGWTTDATRYIEIRTDSANKAGTEWDASKYAHQLNTTSGYGFYVQVSYTRISGIQSYLTNPAFAGRISNFRSAGTGVAFSACFARGPGVYTSGEHWGGFYTWTGNVDVTYVNCIAYSCLKGVSPTGTGNGFVSSVGLATMYNCTAYDCDLGFWPFSGTFVVKNCLAQNCIDGFLGTFGAASTSNCSDLATDAPGTSPVTGTVTFVSATDFALSPYDTVALGAGTNLYADATLPVTTDILGNSRGDATGAKYDIGAFHSTQSIQLIKPSGQGGAYTTLATWEAGENTDLVAVNKSIKAEIDGDWSGSVDTTQVTISGWTTNSTCSITIECVGTGSRHEGIWDNTKYTLVGSPGSGMIVVSEKYANIIGLQVSNALPGNSSIRVSVAAPNKVTVDSSIAKQVEGDIRTVGFSVGGGTVYFNNCLNIHGGWGWDIRWNIEPPTCYLYNCTSFGAATSSFWALHGTNTAINCISQGSLGLGFENPFSVNSDYNISEDTTAPGSNSITSSTVLFIDSASYDFRLDPYDQVALGNGISLYTASYAVTTDIAGTSRGNESASYFDIGAFHSTQSIKTIRPSGQSGSYTTLATWESGEQVDLVSVNKSIKGEINGDWSGSVDTTPVVITGWTTDATHGITIECVGTGSRHSGVWDVTKYQLIAPYPSTGMLRISEAHVRISNMQIQNTYAASGGESSLQCELESFSEFDIHISSCNLVGGRYCVRLSTIGSSGSVEFKNNIVSSGSVGGLYWNGIGNSRYLYAYNNTIQGGSISAIYSTSGISIIKNCILIASAGGVSFSGTTDPASDYNISDDTTAPGSNSITSSTVLFVDSASFDFRIADADTLAKGNGYDLYNNGDVTWNYDIAGVTRTSGSWDIGAFAYVFISGSFIPVTFYRQYSSGFFFN